MIPSNCEVNILHGGTNMQSSDDDQQYGTSPVSVKGSPKAVSTEVGDFVLSHTINTVSPTASEDEYSKILLTQPLEDVFIEQDYEEVKVRKDRISIDSEASVKSDSSEGLDLPIHIEQKERLEELNVITPAVVILDSESNAEITSQIVVDMSRANADLGSQLELREIQARQDALAIRELQQQCQALTMQLQSIQQLRHAEIREAERLNQLKIASEARKKSLQSQVDRVGY